MTCVPDSKYRIEMRYKMDNTDGEFEWCVDGILQDKYTGLDTERGDTFDELRVGLLKTKKCQADVVVDSVWHDSFA